MWEAAFWGAFSASSLLIGAAIALRRELSSRFVGLVMGFGAGALISAVAFVLPVRSVRILLIDMDRRGRHHRDQDRARSGLAMQIRHQTTTEPSWIK
jgi:hypothetical protein